MNWRDTEFVGKLDEAGMAEFASAVAALIVGGASLVQRLESFIQYVERTCTARQLQSRAANRRSLATFFLFLSDPANHIFVKTSVFNSFLTKIGGTRLPSGDLTGDSYTALINSCREVKAFLDEKGWAPKDLIDVQGFIWSVEKYVEGDASDEEEESAGSTPSPNESRQTMTHHPKNQILYGPPGTGKTYRTTRIAVEICDGTAPQNPSDLRARYEELVAAQRIQFVTFHQSYGYEDFIEGIRPEIVVNGESEAATEEMVFRVQDGLFKRMADLAKGEYQRRERVSVAPDDLEKRQFFKISLGRATEPEIADYCFENGLIALGWGDDVDFSKLPKAKDWAVGRDQIKEALKLQEAAVSERAFAAQAVWWFKNGMDVGDIVIASRGLSEAIGIGVVEGEYEYRPETPIRYHQFRRVRWLLKNVSIPVERLQKRAFSQQTIYTINPSNLEMAAIKEMLKGEGDVSPRNYVLIIDEINRGNMAKIFGELITLIEPSRRLGEIDELTATLPASRSKFGVPTNLYLVGTMNTADRSIALLDSALRRRFQFSELLPDPTRIDGAENGRVEDASGDLVDLRELLRTINLRIEFLQGRDHQIGHAYFMKVATLEDLQAVFLNQIVPLLQEYFHEDLRLVQMVLGARLIISTIHQAQALFPNRESFDLNVDDQRAVFSVNQSPQASDFRSVYESPAAGA